MDIQISNVFETRRGKRCFNTGNYKYSEFRVLKSGDLLFRCTNKKCTSRVTVNKSITRVINTSNEHNHEAHTDQNNPVETRNMLLQNPQLGYALLQALVRIKIVDPETARTMLHPAHKVPPPLRISNATATTSRFQPISQTPNNGMQ
ncbi:hypothetical protein QTP88_023771 [Uroleucon formosanum]